MEKSWFVFYTKSRQEKKTRDLLLKQGYEVFLPLQKVMRQWSDRKKKVEVPLFNSYIFVLVAEHQIPEVTKCPGVAWSIRHNGKPAILRSSEKKLIERFIETGYVLETEGITDTRLQSGDRAEIIGGPLAGTVGLVTGDTNNFRFQVLIESLSQVLKIEIPAQLLKKA